MMSVMVAHADQSAPGQLELIRGFVNTFDLEHDTDELSTGAAASGWLTDNSLPGGERALERAERERLIAVREALRELLLANNSGESPPPAALATLNEQSEDAAIGLRFSATGGELVTRCEGVDSSIARLLAIVHEAMRDRPGRGSRCALPTTAGGRSMTGRATAPAPGARWATAAIVPRRAPTGSAAATIASDSLPTGGRRD